MPNYRFGKHAPKIDYRTLRLKSYFFPLDDERLLLLGTSDERHAQVVLAERVRSVSEGAFAPYSQQPLVRAALVPALTYGATAALQYLHISS